MLFSLPFLARRFWWRGCRTRPVRVMQMMIVAGVGVSIAALILTLGVAQGFEKEYKKGLFDFNAHVTVLPSEGISFTREVFEERLSGQGFPVDAIVEMTPYLYREVLLIRQGVIKGAILKGVPREKLPSAARPGAILLGKGLAKKLSPSPELKLLIPEGETVNEKNVKTVAFGGVFESGIYEIDSQFALIELKELQELFQVPESFYGFEIRLKDPEKAPLVATILKEEMGPWVEVQDWVELHRPLFEAVRLEKWVFRILMGLMVFVASLNLIGVILLTIFRKKRTIAVLQSLGLAPGRIRLLFAGEGVFLGTAGVAFGALVGSLLLWVMERFSLVSIDPQIYFLEKLPAVFQSSSVFIIAAFGLLLIGVASWRGAKEVLDLPVREGLHGPG